MAHIGLGHANMMPAPVVRYQIAQEHSRAKKLLVGSTIAAAMIVVMAAMFLSAII